MPDLNRRSAIRTGIFGAVAATAAGTLSAKEAAPESNEYKKLQFDLVVIGAGCAGMTAALEAADLGAKVALLEMRAATSMPRTPSCRRKTASPTRSTSSTRT